MNPRLQKFLLYAAVVVVGGSFLSILIETVRLKNTGFETKTLWDWMELLIIPLFLAGGAFFLNRSERIAEREIATDRQHEAALQAYLDRIASLLLKQKLRISADEEVSDVARIRTISVLLRLDPRRKGLVLRFLREANLIAKSKPKVLLAGADLSNARLSHALLHDTNLSGADFTGADLKLAFLHNTNLRWATLKDANLEGANLEDADLAGANLKGANMKDAKLGAATMPDGTQHE